MSQRPSWLHIPRAGHSSQTSFTGQLKSRTCFSFSCWWCTVDFHRQELQFPETCVHFQRVVLLEEIGCLGPVCFTASLIRSSLSMSDCTIVTLWKRTAIKSQKQRYKLQGSHKTQCKTRKSDWLKLTSHEPTLQGPGQRGGGGGRGVRALKVEKKHYTLNQFIFWWRKFRCHSLICSCLTFFINEVSLFLQNLLYNNM